MLFCPKCGSNNLAKSGFTPSGKQRYRCSVCHIKTSSPAGHDHVDVVFDRKAISNHIKKKSEVFVITSAQNATPVNSPFLNSLLSFCNHKKAKLMVVPYRYKNPTSVFVDKDHDWWDSSIIPYIVDENVSVTDSLWVMGDIKIQPTASKPLSGLESMTGVESAVFGHPKVQLRSIATQAGEMAKIMTTTGSVTIPNYTNSKAGKKGQHHHSYSAVIVEKDGDEFHLRHVTATKDGQFIDLEYEYRPDGTVAAAPPALALVMGDIHAVFMEPLVDKATFGTKGIVHALKPEKVVMQDVLDSYAVSHHDKSDPFKRVKKFYSGMSNIEDEMKKTVKYLKDRDHLANIHIISSNHHNHLKRWLMETDWRNDPENAQFYLHSALAIVDGYHQGVDVNPFKMWVEKSGVKATFHGDNEGFRVGKFELGFHGDVGPNGAKGSLSNLSKIGRKVIIGHSHSPGREDGSIQVGTSSRLDLDYAKGPSSWMHSHAVIYGNGKPTLIMILSNGRWRKG